MHIEHTRDRSEVFAAVKDLHVKLKNFQTHTTEQVVQTIDLVKSFDVDREMIVETEIHTVIKQLCKNRFLEQNRAALIEKVKELRDHWKETLRGEETAPKSLHDKENKPKQPASSMSQSAYDRALIEKALSRIQDKCRAASIEALVKLLNNTEIRERLLDRNPTFPYGVKAVLELATKIETTIYLHVKDSKKLKEKEAYTKRIRERLMLLGQRNNLGLKVQLFEGSLSPEEFAAKDISEFEVDFKKKIEQSQEWTCQATRSDFYLKNTEFKEGEITCHKCKNRKVYTTQKQIRSADEPMTTFCLCVSCNHTWKMG